MCYVVAPLSNAMINKVNWKVGDTIQMIEPCGGMKIGEIYKLVYHEGVLYADYKLPKEGCSCQHKWKLVVSDKIEADISIQIQKEIAWLTNSVSMIPSKE